MKILEIINKRTKSPGEIRRERFAGDLSALMERLAEIRANYDFVMDEQTIDALIFEENAVVCRLEQLYREAKFEGIKLEVYERNKKI